MNGGQEYISDKIDTSKELDAHLSFPKLHLISHSVKQIVQYGALQ